MTPLQILRTALTDGATLTLSKRADGYHVEVKVMDAEGRLEQREVVHARLDQALFMVVAEKKVDGVAGRAR